MYHNLNNQIDEVGHIYPLIYTCLPTDVLSVNQPLLACLLIVNSMRGIAIQSQTHVLPSASIAASSVGLRE